MLCLVLFLLPLLTPSLWPHVRSEKVTEIVAPLAKVPSNADGFIASGEWDDAQVVAVGNTGFGGYLYVKHNSTYLFVHMDCISDTVKSPPGWDNGWVAIDPNMDGGSQPREYDMLFHSTGHLCYIGDGVELIETSQWGILRGHYPEDTNEKYWPIRDEIINNGAYGASGPAFAPTKASQTPHSFWEFRIPIVAILNLVPGLTDKTTFGFAASMQDNDQKRIADWPVTKSTGDFWPGPDSPEGTYVAPDFWGKLTLGSTSLTETPPLPPIEAEATIPYLYVGIAAVGVVVVASVIVMMIKRRGRQTVPQRKDSVSRSA